MLVELQDKIISLLSESQERESDHSTPYPAVIRPYGGELVDPKRYIASVPFVGVEVGQVDFEAMDTVGKEPRYNSDVEIILIVKNEKDERARRSKGAKIVDWALKAIKGKSVDMDGQPVFLSLAGNVRTVPDLLHPYWAAVLTINPFVEGDNA